MHNTLSRHPNWQWKKWKDDEHWESINELENASQISKRKHLSSKSKLDPELFEEELKNSSDDDDELPNAFT